MNFIVRSSHCSDNLGANIILTYLKDLVLDDANGKIIPGSANPLEYQQRCIKIYFYLRKDAKWSDGAKLTAQDFVYSFQRLVDPKTAAEMAYLANVIKNARNIIEGKLSLILLA